MRGTTGYGPPFGRCAAKTLRGRWLESRHLAKVERPSLMGVYRDPFVDLKETLRLVSQYPNLASNIRRLWFGGFHVAETSVHIFRVLSRCDHLQSVTLPWIALRHGTAEDWSSLLGCRPGFAGISSLELLAVDLKEAQSAHANNRTNHRALEARSVDFSCLTRLKLFGDTEFMPVTDEDLRRIATTATNLQEVHVTGISSITIEGVKALVNASRENLRVLEYSPIFKEGTQSPKEAGDGDEHLCPLITSCPRLINLSISLPAICPELFTVPAVRWTGEVQIKVHRLCKSQQDIAGSTIAEQEFWRVLDQARTLMAARPSGSIALEIEVSICRSPPFLVRCANAEYYGKGC